LFVQKFNVKIRHNKIGGGFFWYYITNQSRAILSILYNKKLSFMHMVSESEQE